MAKIFIRAAIVALLAMLLSAAFTMPWYWRSTQLPPPVRGIDNTVLFFALAESGQINVQLATAQALLQLRPNLEIHFASFDKMKDRIARVSSFARKSNPAVRDIVFHSIPGPDRIAGRERQTNCTLLVECLAHPPGARGAAHLAAQMELWLWPWSGEEHVALYQHSLEVIQQVNPAVVVVDYAFRPPLDAVEHLNRVHVVISPLAAANLFANAQPWLSGLWKYPG